MKPEEIGILIVDDEASVRDSLYQWFKADGYRVDTADEATSALKKLQENPWDIILLDIKMPGMDGIELQNRIKQIDKNYRYHYHYCLCLGGYRHSGAEGRGL